SFTILPNAMVLASAHEHPGAAAAGLARDGLRLPAPQPEPDALTSENQASATEVSAYMKVSTDAGSGRQEQPSEEPESSENDPREISGGPAEFRAMKSQPILAPEISGPAVRGETHSPPAIDERRAD